MSNLPPVGMDDAAAYLGLSRRTLTDVLKRHPYYSRAGRANVFYPEDLANLRRVLREETQAKCRTTHTAARAARIGGTASLYPVVSDLGEVLAALDDPKPKKLRTRLRTRSGNVVSMATKRHSHSQRP